MTQLIPLSQGKYALIDDEDYALVSQYQWVAVCRRRRHGREEFYAASHAGRPSDQPLIYMHRLIMAALAGTIVDHINRNPLDNRRCNLRIATPAQNVANQAKHRRLSSRFKGVYWHKKKNNWKVQIGVNRRRMYVGSYTDEIEAARAYDQAARKYFGPFACLNFPSEV